MKQLLTLVFALLLSVNAAAGTLKDAESKALIAKIDEMMVMFEKGNPEGLIAQTHPSVYAISGGKAQFEQAARMGIAQLAKYKVKFISSKLGTPTKTYSAGDEELCFVPRVSVMEINGQRARSTGYMIAIRPIGGKTWKFLDGAGLAKNPDLLYTLLPKLERNIPLPPHGVEKL
jgi:hypothetical protein